jgi:hypothetical protein
MSDRNGVLRSRNPDATNLPIAFTGTTKTSAWSSQAPAVPLPRRTDSVRRRARDRAPARREPRTLSNWAGRILDR